MLKLAMADELHYLESVGGEKLRATALYGPKAQTASDAAGQIIAFTNSWPDPFHPTYPYANPWATKKDNKGKQDPPKVQKI